MHEAGHTSAGRERGDAGPALTVEYVAATLRQEGEMEDGLRILADWHMRLHERRTGGPGGPEKPLDSGRVVSPHVLVDKADTT